VFTRTRTHILEQAGGGYYPEEIPVNGLVLILHDILHDQYIYCLVPGSISNLLVSSYELK